MRKIIYTLSSICFLLLLSSATDKKSYLKSNFIIGDTGILSINKITFGPEGILFIGDSKNAAVYALDTKDMTSINKAPAINIEDFDVKIADALGTKPENIKITDMAVNPISKIPYFSVNTINGTPVLLKLVDNKLENVSLKLASFSKSDLVDAVAADAKDNRGRALRDWAIADMKYHNGKLMVSGLSNKEFASTFRSIPFPFTNNQDYATLEIYHAAHGRYETYAPIKSFTVVNMDNQDYLLASYTCTPLVLFPMKDLTGKKHIKGRTIAELGGGNSPLDMVIFQKDGKNKLYMSNTNRPIMRFDFSDITSFKDNITTEVKEFGKATGVAYDNLPFVNVQQFDDLDDENVLLLRRRNDGVLYLHNRSKRWL